MTNDEFIALHLHDDIRRLAFAPVPDGVDVKWCLEQIEGWRIAVKKLPCWAVDATGVPMTWLWFPPKLSMEQCSSEVTARYKAEVVRRLLSEECQRGKMVDLTGGYGVDFSYIAPLFHHATYIERLPHLCDIARHNFPLLGLQNVSVQCSDGIKGLSSSAGDGLSFVYLDPARRDDVGRKTVAIEDCTPNVVELQDELLQRADLVMVKLSPMLDISEALRKLRCVREIHVVSVRGECRELLLVLWPPHPIHLSLMRDEGVNTAVTCVNLGTADPVFTVNASAPHVTSRIVGEAKIADSIGKYLYEPNASILKAGVQDVLTGRYALKKLHPMSNLFTSDEWIGDFPGRRFKVESVYDFSKKSLKVLPPKANLAIRNFPGTVDALRKRLKLKDGGSEYLFATTTNDGSHCLIRCQHADGELSNILM